MKYGGIVWQDEIRFVFMKMVNLTPSTARLNCHSHNQVLTSQDGNQHWVWKTLTHPYGKYTNINCETDLLVRFFPPRGCEFSADPPHHLIMIIIIIITSIPLTT